MMATYEDILNKILELKQAEVNKRKLRLDRLTIEDRITQNNVPKLRDFVAKIERDLHDHGIAIISELKKASPSKGLLRPHYDPEAIAKDYEINGASCLSVLTESEFFLGTDDHLITAKKTVELPILRKDFIIDEYQIYESRYIGADCILLIVAALSQQQLQDFFKLATELQLEVLVEINNEQELERALDTPTKMIGINNRNLRDFSVDLNRTIKLAEQIPSDRLKICESGIHTREDIVYMQENGVNIFLIGEALMKGKSPGKILSTLLNITKSSLDERSRSRNHE